MEEKGLIESEMRKTSTGRDRKYYRLSEKGRRALEENLRQWNALSKVMEKVQEGISGRSHPTNELA
jgi:DNA-binding PadR family transcriptional regulator